MTNFFKVYTYTPWDKLTHSQKHIILYGTTNENYTICESKNDEYSGVINCLLKNMKRQVLNM